MAHRLVLRRNSYRLTGITSVETEVLSVRVCEDYSTARQDARPFTVNHK